MNNNNNNNKQIKFIDNSFTITDYSNSHVYIKCINILDYYETTDKLLNKMKLMFEIYADENATKNLGSYGICYLRETIEPISLFSQVSSCKPISIAHYWSDKTFNGYNYISVVMDFSNKKVEIYGNGSLIRTEIIPENSIVSPMSLCAGSCFGDNMYFNFGQKKFKMEKPNNTVSMNDFYFNNIILLSNVDIDKTDISVNVNFDLELPGSMCGNRNVSQKVYKNLESEDNLIEIKHLDTRVSINSYIHLDKLE